MNSRNITFNGLDFESIEGLTITHVDAHGSPDRNLSTYNISNADGIIISGEYYGKKNIIIKGYIARNSKPNLESSLNQLREMLQGHEVLMTLPQSNDVLEYTVTNTNLVLDDTTGGFTFFELPFICSDPYGYNLESTTILDIGSLTTENQSYVVTTEGNGSQLPYITITIDSITGASSDLTFGNLTRSESLNISRTWEVGDILIIDAKGGTVTINGADADFTGKIPLLNKGDNTLYYDDNFTSRSVDIIVSYRKRYI